MKQPSHLIKSLLQSAKITDMILPLERLLAALVRSIDDCSLHFLELLLIIGRLYNTQNSKSCLWTGLDYSPPTKCLSNGISPH